MMNEPPRPVPKEPGEPEWLKISVEGDRVIRLETDFTDPNSCLMAFMALYSEMEKRHGAKAARTMARAVQKPDRHINDKHNAEWMTRFCNSGLSLKKFALSLSEENRRLVRDKEPYSRGKRDGVAVWSAMRAGLTLLERGPWGSTDATTIERHVRRLRGKAG